MMVNLWVLLMTVLPVTIGIGMGCFDIILRLRNHHRAPNSAWAIFFTFIVLATVISAVALLLLPGKQPGIAINWLPNSGSMTIHLAQSGLVTATALSIFLLGLVPVIKPTGLMDYGLLLITCGAANLAFISGHFTLRYVALEVVGLCIALYPLVVLGRSLGSEVSRYVFIILRVGDAGFLTAILLFLQYAGTLDIETSLGISTSFAPSVQLWVIGTLGLAVWVKIGLWPFHRWVNAGNLLPSVPNAWLYQAVMPTLGLYLAYRVQPLWVAIPPVSAVVAWVTLAATVLTMVSTLRHVKGPHFVTNFQTVQHGLAFFLAVNGQLHIIPLVLYLAGLRGVLFLIKHSKSHRIRAGATAIAGVATLAFWGNLVARNARMLRLPGFVGILLVVILAVVLAVYFLLKQVAEYRQQTKGSVTVSPEMREQEPVAWTTLSSEDKMLQWFFRVIKRDMPERVLQLMTVSVIGIGQWLYRVIERNTLDTELIKLANGVLKLGQWGYQSIENASLEGFLRWIKDAVVTLSRYLQSLHTGKLRFNLVWVAISMGIVIVALVA